MSSDDKMTYEDHLRFARMAVERRPDLHPTAQEISERRGNYLPLIALAASLSEGRCTKFLLAKLVGELVRGEIK